MADSRVYQNALPIGAMLHEYRLDGVLGAGGFGMTYLGWDLNLEKHVAIKEYLPTDLAVRALDGSVVPITGELQHDYKWGLDRFILEARTLAKFSHPHIVRAMRFFEANATGYMVMEYEKGEPLNELLKRAPQQDETGLKAILLPVLDGLEAVHAAGFLHRDIKPGNIFLRDGGSPVLIDFGAARHAVGGATRSLTSVLTPGYAPLEQYARDGNQGPWSDIYAMGGVLYRALANDNPPDAVSRLKGDTVSARLEPLRGRVSQPFLRAVEWALQLDEKQRPQSVSEWRRALTGGPVPVPPARPAAQAVQTVRSDAGNAPTIVGQPTLRPETRRAVTRQPEKRESSGWRWVGIGVTVLLVVVSIGVWNRHRATQDRVRQEAAQVEAARLAAEKEAHRQAAERAEIRRRAEAEVQRLVAPPAQPPIPEAAAARDRPGREREERPAPGGEPAGNLERAAGDEFRSADANNDGYLSPDEVWGRFPYIAKEFRRVDGNGDGRVSPDEFIQLRRRQAGQKFRNP